MINIESISEKLQNFFNNKQIAIICVVLVAMTLCATLIAISTDKGKEKAEVVVTNEQDFMADQPILLPQDDKSTEGYTFSRNKKDKWTIEETEQWFTAPTTQFINELSSANDKLVKDITGAAP